MDFGGLKLKNSSIKEIKISEDGEIEGGGFASEPALPVIERKIRYHTDCTVQVKPSFDIACSGTPETGFLKRIVDYRWMNDGLAQRLNEDTHLREMLIAGKAPAMAIRGNHIRIVDEKFPTLAVFQCIDRIAEHIRQGANS